MTNSEIKKIATGFKRGLLNKRSSALMCFAVAAPLCSYLRCLGVECELVEGAVGRINHFWILLPNKKILDPTSNQFSDPFTGKKMPSVYIGEKPAWYSLSFEPPGDNITETGGKDAKKA